MCEITKKCTKCKEEKGIDLFGKRKTGRDGINSVCKECARVAGLERSTLECAKEKEVVVIKTCSKCKLEQSPEVFRKCSECRDGLQQPCKSCRKIYTDSTKDVRKIKANKYYNENIDEIAEKSKIYRLKNKISILEAQYKWINNKLATDNFYKFKTNVRKLFYENFKNSGYRKKTKTDRLLNCSFEEFKIHIESQFLSWMSWDNFGNACGANPDYNCSWDLDHIVPLSLATTEEEVYLLCHWSNFQPLCSRVNRFEKKDKLFPCSNLELNKTYNGII